MTDRRFHRLVRGLLGLCIAGSAVTIGATLVRHDDGPAVVHYAPTVQEDEAGDACAAQGGTLVDAPDRFVCLVP